MTPREHLQMLINKAYFENDAVYRALMAQRDVEIQNRERFSRWFMETHFEDGEFAACGKTRPRE